MKTPSLLLVSALVLVAVLVTNVQNAAQSPVAMEQRATAFARGLRAFFDQRLSGLEANGRSCADCHMPTDQFQLSPVNVEARFQLLQFHRQWDERADDPLFRPVDADDFRINGDNASDYSNLRENGLIRITFALPPNFKLIDPLTGAPSTEEFVDVWRMVPTVNDVALTGSDDTNPWPRGPNKTGGYQLDARVGTLEEQALGALVNHAEIGNMPPQQLLDDLASFQRALFTNHRTRALADAIREGTTPLPDVEPHLDALEEQGKTVFTRACAHCHGGATQASAVAPIARFHDIATQCPRPVDAASNARFAFAPCPPRLARNARTYEITLANGTKTRRTSSDPGRALLTGFVGGAPPTDDWNKFDMPALRGIRNTAPYFHNNSADTLEDVVDHYIEFFKRVRANAAPGVVPLVATTDGINFDRQPLPEERAALVAFLRAQ